MSRVPRLTTGAAAGALALVGILTGCSKSGGSPTAGQATAANETGAANGSSDEGGDGSTGQASPGGSSAAGGDSDILDDNPGCHLLSASDVKNAAGIGLPSLLGNLGGGVEGNQGHESCTYTQGEGTGPSVNIDINKLPGTVKDQLAKLRTTYQDQASDDADSQAGTATLKDISLGDGGFEFDYHASAGSQEFVFYTKGDSLVELSVDQGVAGAAFTLAQEIAGKI